MNKLNKLNSIRYIMGNKLNETNKQSLLSQIHKEYEEVRQDSRGMVLLHKQSQNSYLLKEYTYCCQVLFQGKMRQITDQIERGPQQYIISPIRVESKTFSSFCSTSYKIYAIFQYPQVTLREQISARQKENKNFEEAQLWSILQSCANALSELKPIVSLNTNQIFINPDGHLKIIHDDLVDENYRAVLNPQMYYAPQKLKNFNKNDTDLSLRKQAIFSMGMSILEAAQLADVSSCYDINSCSFDQTKLMEMLDCLVQKYSPDFLEILGNILEANPNRRASLMEVQKVLDNYWGVEANQNAMQSNQFQKQQQIETEQKQREDKKASQLPLAQKCPNEMRPSLRDHQRKSLKQIQVNPMISNSIPSFKLQKPKIQQHQICNLTTPKNAPVLKQNNLYTDPKLLEMIRKDLEDINKLKQSAFYQTSKYTFMLPQTQSILNSIKNFETEPNPTQTQITTFYTAQQTVLTKMEQNRQFQQKRGTDLPSNKLMMKKSQPKLVFALETYENGRRYEGTTLNGKKHGQGKLIFEDGAYYEGEFKDDKMNGKGILYYSQNYPAYDGEWYNDQFHGKGVLYNQNPQSLESEYDFRDMNEVEDFWVRYEGQFVLDNKSGNGRLLLTNGEIFEGQFSDDNVNGQGRYICMNGQVIDGAWDSNILVQVIRAQ